MDMIGKAFHLAGIPILVFGLLFAVACGGDPTPATPADSTMEAAASSTSTAATLTDQASKATEGFPPGSSAATTPAAASRSQTEGGAVNVVTTSNILSDWVRVVGGNRVNVHALLPPNADPHTYQPGAQDITRLADADLVLSIGLSLEGGWLEELIENAARDHEAIVAVGNVVDPIDFMELVDDHAEEESEEVVGRLLIGDGETGMVSVIDLEHGDSWEVSGNPTKVAFVGILGETDEHEEHGHEEGEYDGHGHGELDPHFWFDPLRVQQAVNSIAARLSTTDPAGQTFYRDNAAAYGRELDELHAWIEEQVGTLPEDRRVLVTSHDSFQYFAQRYGFEVAGAIFPVSTDAEPTAQDLAKLIEVIEQEGVPAVFTEKSHSERLAQRVAEETGATLIGGLYTGSLSAPGGEAGNYIDLMRYNTTTIVEALR